MTDPNGNYGGNVRFHSARFSFLSKFVVKFKNSMHLMYFTFIILLTLIFEVSVKNNWLRTEMIQLQTARIILECSFVRFKYVFNYKFDFILLS